MRIGIAGIRGRVGRLLVEEAMQSGMIVAGGTIRPGGNPQALPGIALFDRIDELAARSDVVIDFTHADTVIPHAAALEAAGTSWVLGTTGFSPEADAAVGRAARRIVVVQAANFSPGVTLVTRLAGLMAAALGSEAYDAEILEMHHRQKVDAPSGTALALGRAVAEARGVRLEDVRESGRDGHTGPRQPGAIGFAALRGGQIVGEHALSFTAGTEQITLAHKAFDRRVFAAGALRAALWTKARPQGRFDMADVLGLP